MKLELMRYKGFTFLCNPLSLQITDEGDFIKQEFPFYGEKLSNSCHKLRRIKGKGELRGKDCLEQYANLRALQKDKNAGVLSLPGMMPFSAYFVSLTVSADVTPDTVFYEFEFSEKSSFEDKNRETDYHTAAEEETLFDIAQICKTDVDTLVRLNPHIKRPDELEKGERVRIC